MAFNLLTLLVVGQSLIGTTLADTDDVQNPSLGIGLSGVVDWSTQQPFVDVMKTARPWIGHLPGQWGGWSHDDLAAGGFLDADGWPRSVPAELEAVATLVLAGQPEDARSTSGRYRLAYRGQGQIDILGARDVTHQPGEVWFKTDPASEHVIVTIRQTDPSGAGDYVRDMSIVHESKIRLHELGVVFNPDWVLRIGDFRVVRFMDWMATNNSLQREWADRPKPADYTYARIGVPIEIMVALANEISADPWFNMPHLASDDYVRRFATSVRDTLRPTLKAHVEYSNEVWNFQFEQARWAEEQGLARWHQKSKWVEYYGMRAAEIVDIWDAVYGKDAGARLVKVVATQTGWLGLETAILDAPLWVAEDPAKNRPPASHFDAYAVTGYVGGGLVSEAKAPLVRDWLAQSQVEAERKAAKLAPSDRAAFVDAHKYDLATIHAAQELRDGSLSGDDGDTLENLLGEVLPHHARTARARNLDLIMYEGGSHVVGHGAAVDNDAFTAFLTHFNYTREMAQIYSGLLEGWREIGGTTFNAFVDVARPSKWGSWGALRHLDDVNPRWDVLNSFNRNEPAWWATRAPDTFRRGVYIDADRGADAFIGTPQPDILIGTAGDDLLVSGGGDDRIHGGGGKDIVELPGRRGEYEFAWQNTKLLASGGHGTATLVGIHALRFTNDENLLLSVGALR